MTNCRCVLRGAWLAAGQNEFLVPLAPQSSVPDEVLGAGVAITCNFCGQEYLRFHWEALLQGIQAVKAEA